MERSAGPSAHDQSGEARDRLLAVDSGAPCAAAANPALKGGSGVPHLHRCRCCIPEQAVFRRREGSAAAVSGGRTG